MAIEPQPRETADFDALVAEAVTQIPRLAPQWTDHNASDPGITLIELLAFVTEVGGFQVERLDAERRRAFARRLGLVPAAPTAAEVVVQLHPRDDADAGRAVPVDTPLVSPNEEVFSTRMDLRLQLDQTEPEIVCAGAYGASWTDERPCRPFAAEPQPGASFTLRFQRPLAGEVGLYLWTGADDHDRELRARLVAAAATMPCSASEPFVHYGATLGWESLTRDGRWVPVRLVADQTRALTLSGFLRLELTEAHGAQDGAYPLRCRIVDGTYDEGPRLRRVLVNAVPARHDRALQPADGWWLLGFGAGHATEQFLMPAEPVVCESCEVRVVEPSGLPGGAQPAIGRSLAIPTGVGEPWEVVLSWDRTGPHDRHVRLDPPSGRITFGDGRIGWVPRAGHAVVARARYGGGSAGNIPPRTLSRAASSIDLRVEQPFAAAGGADGETTDELAARMLDRHAHTRRAVTLGDLERMATTLPGLPVARAWALPQHHPRVPGLVASGCVTLVVIPPCPDARPMPSPTLLDAVARGLELGRPLTTQLIVAPPSYSEIAIEARLHLCSGADPEEVRQVVIDALAEWIHPIRGGADGEGWPPGRDLHRAEVMALLMGPSVVQAVDRFAFLAGGRRSRCESTRLCPQKLLIPGEHQLTFVQET